MTTNDKVKRFLETLNLDDYFKLTNFDNFSELKKFVMSNKNEVTLPKIISLKGNIKGVFYLQSSEHNNIISDFIINYEDNKIILYKIKISKHNELNNYINPQKYEGYDSIDINKLPTA